jgi:hypothetical protein
MSSGVCLCGSFRFYDEMLALATALRSRGVPCEWPPEGPRTAPAAMDAEAARAAIVAHLERIDRAGCIFVFDPGGYVGRSVVMEIGYARARAKPIYALAPIDDAFVMPLVTAVLTPEALMELLRDG